MSPSCLLLSSQHRRRPTAPSHERSAGASSSSSPPIRPLPDLVSPLLTHHASRTTCDDQAGASTVLPPPEMVIEAIKSCSSSYFQLGFLHKAQFIERYITEPERVSSFLLLAICSIAAAFAPSIVKRYGGRKQAVDFFLDQADHRHGAEMVRPSLERAQACELFFQNSSKQAVADAQSSFLAWPSGVAATDRKPG